MIAPVSSRQSRNLDVSCATTGRPAEFDYSGVAPIVHKSVASHSAPIGFTLRLDRMTRLGLPRVLTADFAGNGD